MRVFVGVVVRVFVAVGVREAVNVNVAVGGMNVPVGVTLGVFVWVGVFVRVGVRVTVGGDVFVNVFVAVGGSVGVPVFVEVGAMNVPVGVALRVHVTVGVIEIGGGPEVGDDVGGAETAVVGLGGGGVRVAEATAVGSGVSVSGAGPVIGSLKQETQRASPPTRSGSTSPRLGRSLQLFTTHFTSVNGISCSSGRQYTCTLVQVGKSDQAGVLSRLTRPALWS